MTTTRRRCTRRRLLGAALGAAGAGVAFPMIVPATALGRGRLAAPSKRIRLGLVGCGNHGITWNLDQIFRCPDVQVVGVCDVDRGHLADGQKRVDGHYGEVVGKGYAPCAAVGDFRKLITRDDIDAVANCTPDHWHVIPAILAAKCGKDVICEKPLTLTVAEGQALVKAVRDHKRVFQTASENRSIDVYIRLASLVRSGAVGRLRAIRVGLPEGNTDMRLGPQSKDTYKQRAVAAVPPELDYDMWLGQAPALPYIPARVHGAFRWNLAFSGGVLTDWGAHMIDLAQWGHNTEGTGPVRVEGRGDFPPADAVFNTAATFALTYEYADGVKMDVATTGASIRFEGTEGWIQSVGWRGALEASDPAILAREVDPKAVGVYVPSEVVPAGQGNRGGEHRNFADCVKSRADCYAPAETGHRTISIAHLGNIAMQLGRALRWDPAREDFVEDSEASQRLSRPQREPWTLAQIDRWL
jgi:predicted dehydrogenase